MEQLVTSASRRTGTGRGSRRRRLVGVLAGLAGAVVMQIPVVGPAAAAPGAWSPTGNLIIGRSGAAAVRLTGAKVLVVGGETSQGALDSAEVYRPDTRSWSFTGGLTTARYRHTATVLADGRVLVVGGRNGSGPLASAEVYDPASKTWSSAGTLTTGPRYWHTATLLPDGRVLVAGGLSGRTIRVGGNVCFCGELVSLQTAEIWDPANGLFSAVGALNVARDSFTATLLPNGKVLAAGGYGETSSELFDPAARTWSSTGIMATAHMNHTANLLADGTVLVTGGGQGGPCCTAVAERYNPADGMWSSAGSMSSPRGNHTATVLTGGACSAATRPAWCGKVMVTGGDSSGSTDLFNPVTGVWKPMGSLGTARITHTATLLKDGKVLVAGGDGPLASAEIFAPPA